MWYECPVCRGRVRGDEGRLLQLLPDNIRQTYPVPPRYACGGYHLHKDLVDVLEASMKTYANADFVSSLLHRKQGKRYTDKCSSYLCQEIVESFCNFDDFIGSTRPPNGQSLRALYEEAEYSLLTPYGYSQVERYQRELQQVEVGESDIVAFDHTFAALKCYSDLPGAKAIFTGMKGSTQEVVSLGIVPSTSLADAAHLLQQSKLRRTLFRPSVVYTDTCPHGQEFWQTLFGHQVETKLGLFHFIHRIVDTMDNRCEFFFDAIVALKNAIYTYNASDEAALLESLKNGTFSKAKRKYDDEEIHQLRRSKQWKANCEPFLRKNFRPLGTAQDKLTEWIGRFEGQYDSKGRSVFSFQTARATREQMSKLKHVHDSERADAYRPVPPGPRSTHQLTKWASNRPESSLERFHGQLAHYANCGSRSSLADALCLRGTAEYNVACRLRARKRGERNDGIDDGNPRYLDNLPVFLDHALLQDLNSKAAAKSLSPPFRNVDKTTANNGEVFLAQYFRQQLARNENSPAPKGPVLCSCLDCTEVRLEDIVGGLNGPPDPEEPGILGLSDSNDNVSLLCPSANNQQNGAYLFNR